MFFVIKQKSIIIVGLIFIIVFTTSFFILSFATNEPESCDLMHEVKEKYHYETIAEYPNGGKDVKKVVDVEAVEAKEAWDEEIPIQKYILYTAEELEAKLNEIKNTKIANFLA